MSPNLQKRKDCLVKPGKESAVENFARRRADIGPNHRYIHAARHVRAFGVALDFGT